MKYVKQFQTILITLGFTFQAVAAPGAPKNAESIYQEIKAKTKQQQALTKTIYQAEKAIAERVSRGEAPSEGLTFSYSASHLLMMFSFIPGLVLSEKILEWQNYKEWELEKLEIFLKKMTNLKAQVNSSIESFSRINSNTTLREIQLQQVAAWNINYGWSFEQFQFEYNPEQFSYIKDEMSALRQAEFKVGTLITKYLTVLEKRVQLKLPQALNSEEARAQELFRKKHLEMPITNFLTENERVNFFKEVDAIRITMRPQEKTIMLKFAERINRLKNEIPTYEVPKKLAVAIPLAIGLLAGISFGLTMYDDFSREDFSNLSMEKLEKYHKKLLNQNIALDQEIQTLTLKYVKALENK